MGMYDTILCKYTLPLNEELQSLVVAWKDIDFQTKSLDNSMELYTITEDGKIEREVIEREYILYDEKELKATKRKPWDVYKDVIIKNRYVEPVDYHGVVRFYTNVNYTESEDIWVEFDAYFNYSKIDKIVLVKTERTVSYKASNQKWEEERKQQAAKPWSRVRAFLRPLGWRWFWLFVSRLCLILNDRLVNMHTFIFKHIL